MIEQVLQKLIDAGQKLLTRLPPTCLTELANEISEQRRAEISNKNVAPEEFRAILAVQEGLLAVSSLILRSDYAILYNAGKMTQYFANQPQQEISSSYFASRISTYTETSDYVAQKMWQAFVSMVISQKIIFSDFRSKSFDHFIQFQGKNENNNQ